MYYRHVSQNCSQKRYNLKYTYVRDSELEEHHWRSKLVAHDIIHGLLTREQITFFSDGVMKTILSKMFLQHPERKLQVRHCTKI
jgi:hypothetical protein